jgi:hypothetical protein
VTPWLVDYQLARTAKARSCPDVAMVTRPVATIRVPVITLQCKIPRHPIRLMRSRDEQVTLSPQNLSSTSINS